MKKAEAIAGVFVVFITMPIWFYLLYQILVRVNASELMFFLFWIYVPVTLIATIIVKVFGIKEQ